MVFSNTPERKRVAAQGAAAVAVCADIQEMKHAAGLHQFFDGSWRLLNGLF